MDLNALREFTMVALHGGFGAASRQAGIPKASLSRRIRQLEDELGVRLIDRSSHAFRLTPEGELLRQDAAPLIAELAQLRERMHPDQEPRGPLRISAPMLLAHSTLGALAAQYRKRYPQVQLEIVGEDRFVDLITEGYDAIIRVNPKEDADYIGRCFLRERQVLAISSAAGQLEHARPLPLVCLPQRADQRQLAIQRDGRKMTLETATVLALSSPFMIRDAVLAGAGAGILPPSLIRQELQDGRLREIGALADSEAEIWLLYPSRRHVSSRLRAFSDLLLETFPDARMR
ncbi:LysR family transcriptional regulator [Collimonas sp.]|jgi:DNA-binding transcriptional LysR family regulator|uniref:LysR family transcriptional regulator n=1 Tax=Collimonas sp. TaxID=1963772 RepID=UPI002B791D16|nr:LysR family transcriptional regulator [Collimonas sp.]HWW99593.1 LysR family transcriptional regulator [Collimonas sp.]